MLFGLPACRVVLRHHIAGFVPSGWWWSWGASVYWISALIFYRSLVTVFLSVSLISAFCLAQSLGCFLGGGRDFRTITAAPEEVVDVVGLGIELCLSIAGRSYYRLHFSTNGKLMAQSCC
jgi:hypothetical protein